MLASACAVAVALAGCVPAAVQRGRRAMDEGAFEEAAAAFREAASDEPDDPARWMELGLAEMAADRPRRAREAFERAAALRPRSTVPRIHVGYTWELERKWDEALIAYRQATEIAPNEARAWRILGSRLLRWGKSAPAIEPLSRAVALDPTHAETWNALALAQYDAGQKERAERTFRRAIAEHPEHRGVRLGLAALLVNERRFEEALAVYDEVAARWPEMPAVHVGRALLLDELGRTAEAEGALERAVEVARDPRPYRARLEEYRALLGRRGAAR